MGPRSTRPGLGLGAQTPIAELGSAQMSEKRYLLTPGPTPVPPEVLAAISQPVVHHRGPDFKPVYERTLARLREVFLTERDVLLFAAAGTGAMESAVANLCSPGERVLVVSAGHFGERWRAIAAAYGAQVGDARVRVGRDSGRRGRRRPSAGARRRRRRSS